MAQTCPHCGTAVDNRAKHSDWHREIDRKLADVERIDANSARINELEAMVSGSAEVDLRHHDKQRQQRA